MTALFGTDLLLRLDYDQSGTFVTVAGLRSKRVSLNAQTVDVTDGASSGRWRELLEGAGIRHAALSGTGIFKDAASDELIRACFFDANIRDWEVTLPEFGAITGPFQITTLEFSAEHDGAVLFDMTLESAGELSFVAQ